jgi:hypothetical protein
VCHQTDDPNWRKRLTLVIASIEAEHTPWWKHWTEVFGQPGNWRDLSPETQRSWIVNRYDQLTMEHPGRGELLKRAKYEALASVGQILPG